MNQRLAPRFSVLAFPLLLAGFSLLACDGDKEDGSTDDASATGGTSLGGDSGTDAAAGSGASESGGAAAGGGSGGNGSGGTSACGADDTDDDGVGDDCDVDLDGDGLIEVSTLEQLDWIRNSLGGYARHDGTTGDSTGCPGVSDGGCHGYELTQSLDFDTNGDELMNADDTYFDPLGDGSNKGFAPIVNFFGTFEGNGHSISNLYIDRPTETSVGFFGVLRDSTGQGFEVQNVEFDGALTRVAGRYSVGILAGSILTLNAELSGGTLFSSSVRNVGAAGAVFCAGSADTDAAGGLIGLITATNYLTEHGSIVSLEKLTFRGTVSGTEQAGGLIGRIAATKGGSVDGTELRSDATITVAATSGYRGAGGILGSASTETYGTAPGPLHFEKVAAFGNVTSTSCAGGLLGYVNAAAGSIDFSHAIAVAKVSSGSTAGGVLGCLGSGDSGYSFGTSQSYVLGAVTGTASVTGSYLGYAGGGTLATSDVFYASGETGQAEDIPFVDDPNIDNVSLATLECAPSSVESCTLGTTVFENFDDAWNFGTSTELPGLTIDGALVRPTKSDGAYVMTP